HSCVDQSNQKPRSFRSTVYYPNQIKWHQACVDLIIKMRIDDRGLRMEHPVCISTWEFGLKAVKKASELFSKDLQPLDVIEQSIWVVEDDPDVASVGFGGLPNQNGIVELDAVIFDGPRKKIGAVASLTGIRHAISVARLVMEKSPYILLAGLGAKEFA